MVTVTRTPGPGAAKLKTILAGLKNAETKVGVIDAVKYEDGTPVAYVAAVQEFGVPRRSIPPRPVFRPTIAEKSDVWRAKMDQLARKLEQGTSTTEAMELIGMLAAGDIRKKYSSITSPPLSLVTLRLRKLKREGVKVTGKLVGAVHRAMNTVGPKREGSDSSDISGVSTKPLVFDGILLGSITSETKAT